MKKYIAATKPALSTTAKGTLNLGKDMSYTARTDGLAIVRYDECGIGPTTHNFTIYNANGTVKSTKNLFSCRNGDRGDSSCSGLCNERSDYIYTVFNITSGQKFEFHKTNGNCNWCSDETSVFWVPL